MELVYTIYRLLSFFILCIVLGILTGVVIRFLIDHRTPIMLRIVSLIIVICITIGIIFMGIEFY